MLHLLTINLNNDIIPNFCGSRVNANIDKIVTTKYLNTEYKNESVNLTYANVTKIQNTILILFLIIKIDLGFNDFIIE